MLNAKKLKAQDKIVYLKSQDEYTVVFDVKKTNLCPNYANKDTDPQWLPATILIKYGAENEKNPERYIFALKDLKDFFLAVPPQTGTTWKLYELYSKLNNEQEPYPLLAGIVIARDEYDNKTKEMKKVLYRVLVDSTRCKLKQDNYLKNPPSNKEANSSGVAYLGVDKNTGNETIFIRNRIYMTGFAQAE